MKQSAEKSWLDTFKLNNVSSKMTSLSEEAMTQVALMLAHIFVDVSLVSQKTVLVGK